jgi:hypothetical protein
MLSYHRRMVYACRGNYVEAVIITKGLELKLINASLILSEVS